MSWVNYFTWDGQSLANCTMIGGTLEQRVHYGIITACLPLHQRLLNKLTQLTMTYSLTRRGVLHFESKYSKITFDITSDARPGENH
jgi:hypothetical protein